MNLTKSSLKWDPGPQSALKWGLEVNFVAQWGGLEWKFLKPRVRLKADLHFWAEALLYLHCRVQWSRCVHPSPTKKYNDCDCVGLFSWHFYRFFTVSTWRSSRREVLKRAFLTRFPQTTWWEMPCLMLACCWLLQPVGSEDDCHSLIRSLTWNKRL